jgi:hypothetical protein
MLVKVLAHILTAGEPNCTQWVSTYCKIRLPISTTVFEKRITIEGRSGKSTIWSSAQIVQALAKTNPTSSVAPLFIVLSAYDGPTFDSHIFLTTYAEKLCARKLGLALFRPVHGSLVASVGTFKKRIPLHNEFVIKSSKPPKLVLLPSKRLRASLLREVREKTL